MPSGIGASITTLSNGTIADGPTVTANLNALNSGGIANDSGAITTNGSGTMTLPGVTITTLLSLLTGTLTRVAKYSGVSDQVITHGLGVTPDLVIPYYAGAFGTAPTQALAVKSAGSTTFEVVGQTGYSWIVLAIKF